MDSKKFNFKENTKDGITYYIIPAETYLYHGSNTLSSEHDFKENQHTFFALNEEYARKYAKSNKGKVFKFKLKAELPLVAMDKPNEKLYEEATDEIQTIMDNNYGFHTEHKRKSIGKKDKELSEYLCENDYNGYAAGYMTGKSADENLDPEIIICNKENLEFIEITYEDTGSAPERPTKKRRETNYESVDESPSGKGLFGEYDSDDESSRREGGKKNKKNIQNIYKNKTMKRPVRGKDGMYTIKGKKYKELFGSREQVYNGTAYKTKAGLTIDDIIMNKWGRLVSAKKHKTAKKEMRLEKYGYSAKKGKFGYVKTKSKTRKNKKEKID
jgi:hypothetical protein